MAKQKGTKTFTIEIGTLVVTVECDEDDGYVGTKDELEEAVQRIVTEDIEGLTLEGDGWVSTDITIRLMGGC